MKEYKYIILSYVNLPNLRYPYVSCIRNIHEEFKEYQDTLKIKVGEEFGYGYTFNYLIYDISKEEDINILLNKLLNDLKNNSKREMKERYLRDFEVGSGNKIFKHLKNFIEIPKELYEVKISKVEGSLEKYMNSVEKVKNRDTGKYL